MNDVSGDVKFARDDGRNAQRLLPFQCMLCNFNHRHEYEKSVPGRCDGRFQGRRGVKTWLQSRFLRSCRSSRKDEKKQFFSKKEGLRKEGIFVGLRVGKLVGLRVEEEGK